jgi:hypothetical protein
MHLFRSDAEPIAIMTAKGKRKNDVGRIAPRTLADSAFWSPARADAIAENTGRKA